MRYSTLLTAIVSVFTLAPLHGDDGLFSEVAMESVFQTSENANPIASKNLSGSVDRVTSVSSLLQALTAAGFEARESDGRAAFTLSQASWKFPVAMAVQVDQDRLDCRLSLAEIADGSPVSSQKLLKLLASGDSRGTSFAYDHADKTIQVRGSLSNRSITASELKADLIHMASFAERHADLWSNLTVSAKPDAASRTAANPRSPTVKSSPKTDSIARSTPASTESASVASLVGRWSASLANDEAFAIQIAADARFQLVHLKSGKSTVSKGKISRSGKQMKLVGDGDLTLDCSVAQASGDKFALAIKDGKGNIAMTLNFKKAK